MSPYGITVPFDAPLHEHAPLFKEVADLGYTDVWSGEANAADGLTPLILAAAWEPRLRVGPAILPAYTRTPGLMAQSAASLAAAAPGRCAFGIGTSSDVIVEKWNGVPFDEPYKRTRDMVRFLKDALTGEKVDKEYDTFTIRGFRLAMRVPQPPPILVAALRPGMLRMAGREADGAIINWLSADDVKQVAPEVGADKEIVARIFVCPSEDADTVRAAGKFAIAAYLNVDVYAKFHEWLGRGDDLAAMWTHWKQGDRKAATAAIPDHVVDQLIVHGHPDSCREQIASYVDNGVTTPVLAVMPFGMDTMTAVRALAPK
ncbi:MAG TPA: LLM class F420-dependent oxidoreductase [Acidimicrobiales bacterium]|nr:LLM class F420-dependent oxidoreductase [Acidimicrobiales bacterium]